MDNVISINKKSHTLSGDARCVGCRHEWVAVAPVGTNQLICPSCESVKGIFMNPVFRFEYLHLACSCSNDYLHITPEGYYCPNCGQWVIP